MARASGSTCESERCACGQHDKKRNSRVRAQAVTFDGR